MSDCQKDSVLRLIAEHGGTLVRQRKHHIYRFPSGKVFVVPNTPSDIRAWHHSMATLKRVLGMRHVQQAGIPPGKNHPPHKTHKVYPVACKFMASEASPTSLKSALEKSLIEQEHFEALMLAQGVRKLEVA